MGSKRLGKSGSTRRSPNSCSFSENRSWDIVEEVFDIGAGGYVVKSDAGRELLPAVKAVLQGQQFVSTSLIRHDLTHPTHEQTDDYYQQAERIALIPPQNGQIARRHEFVFVLTIGNC
jgi:DNA-binding NarL/FixJ family response regulator